MPDLDSITPDDWFFKGLFVGKNGGGKTLAASSFPKPLRIYDFDGRTAPLINFLSPEQKKGISFETIGPSKVNDFCREFQELQSYNPYNTVVIDSLTSLSLSLMNYYLSLKGKGSKKDGKMVGQTQVPTWDEINGETALTSQILDVAKVLRCHVIMTAHPVAKTIITPGGSRRGSELVAFGNKLPSIVPNYFNEIYQFFIEAGVDEMNNDIPRHIIYTRPNNEEDMMKTALPIPRRIDITSMATSQGKKEYNFSLWDDVIKRNL